MISFSRASATLVLATLACLSTTLHAQAVPTATRPTHQVGVGWSVVDADSGFPYVQGVSIFADQGLYKRLSAQMDIHLASMHTPAHVGEQTYMFGPRVDILKQDRFRAYAKGMGGLGRFLYKAPLYNPQASDYFVVGFGGGFEYRASRHFNIRAIDIEVQKWTNYPGYTLTPIATTFGIAYVP
jgi:hypothetical protein